MTDTEQADHQVGQEITVRWPDGPHDYVIEYYDRGGHLLPKPSEGWQYIRGVQVKPAGPGWRSMRTFYVRPVGDGVYELRPLGFGFGSGVD